MTGFISRFHNSFVSLLDFLKFVAGSLDQVVGQPLGQPVNMAFIHKNSVSSLNMVVRVAFTAVPVFDRLVEGHQLSPEASPVHLTGQTLAAFFRLPGIVHTCRPAYLRRVFTSLSTLRYVLANLPVPVRKKGRSA
jgi:hypothetical protein